MIDVSTPYRFDRTRVLVNLKNAPLSKQVLYAEHVDFKGPLVRIDVKAIPSLIKALTKAYARSKK
jgi:hypothetical protein